MTIQRMHTTERSSQIVAHGGTVYLAGQVARDAPDAPIERQTETVLERIDTLLAEAGTNKSRLLNATIWLADPREFLRMNAIWSAWLPAGTAPARAVVEARLAYPEFRVEIAVIAAA